MNLRMRGKIGIGVDSPTSHLIINNNNDAFPLNSPEQPLAITYNGAVAFPEPTVYTYTTTSSDYDVYSRNPYNICPVHGDVENSTLNITLKDKSHTYCLYCLDALLEKFLHPLEEGGGEKKPSIESKETLPKKSRYDIIKEKGLDKK